MIRPLKIQRVNVDGTCLMEFAPGSLAPSGLYRAGGGLCWPTSTDRGFVVLAVLNVNLRRWYYAEQAWWDVVDASRIDDDGAAPLVGLADLLNEYHDRYWCGLYSVHDIDATRRTFGPRIYDCLQIRTQPDLRVALWATDAAALGELAQLGLSGDSVGEAGSPVDLAMAANEVAGDTIQPPLRAAMSAAWTMRGMLRDIADEAKRRKSEGAKVRTMKGLV